LLDSILAIAVYFLLLFIGLGHENAMLDQEVISFVVSLVTENVIQTLIRFKNEKLSFEK
jgi:hypothetical protein